MRNPPVETVENGIYKLEIFYDTEGRDPWEDEDDNCFRFISNHRDYCSYGWGSREKNRRIDLSDFDGKESRLRAELGKGWSLFPVYAYIHSGITVSLGRSGQYADRWDSGMFGILCINGPAIYGKRANLKVKGCAETFVKTWDQALTGDVYGYRVSVNRGTEVNPDWDEIDSVWGFYGIDSVMEEGKSALAHCVKTENEAEAFERSAMAI